MKKLTLYLGILVLATACSQSNKNQASIGFVDYVKDETLELAKKGFYQALNDSGYSEEKGNLKMYYKNAQGDQATLLQIMDYMSNKNVDMLASNTTLATISAVQKLKNIPVCMMVAPRPDLANLLDKNGKPPANLFGTYETLSYIDTATLLIKQLVPSAKKVGLIYTQSEPQSVAALEGVRKICRKQNLQLLAMPVNSSAETQTIVDLLLAKDIDVFFALPDNVVFSSFETLVQSCNRSGVPIFTSEQGLVGRGALAAFGADMYAWGYQSGCNAVYFLKAGKGIIPKLEEVKKRSKVINEEQAKKFNINIPKDCQVL